MSDCKVRPAALLVRTVLGTAILAATAFGADPPRPAGIVDIAGLLGRLNGGQSAIEINQARALAGGISPDDAPGFPVSVSQPGAYILTGNLLIEGASTSAIEISASGVSLDLRGFAIVGPVTCTRDEQDGPVTSCSPFSEDGYGIDIKYPAGGIRIHNGSIRGMGFGGITGANSIISSMTVTGNGGTGIAVGSSLIENSTAMGNASFGIQAGGAGNVVRNNIVQFNGRGGILSAYSNIFENTVSDNKGAGIDCCGGICLVRGNVALRNELGISVCNGAVIDNLIYGSSVPQLRMNGMGSWGGNTLGASPGDYVENNLYDIRQSQPPFITDRTNELSPNTCNGLRCGANVVPF